MFSLWNIFREKNWSCSEIFKFPTDSSPCCFFFAPLVDDATEKKVVHARIDWHNREKEPIRSMPPAVFYSGPVMAVDFFFFSLSSSSFLPLLCCRPTTTLTTDQHRAFFFIILADYIEKEVIVNREIVEFFSVTIFFFFLFTGGGRHELCARPRQWKMLIVFRVPPRREKKAWESRKGIADTNSVPHSYCEKCRRKKLRRHQTKKKEK